MRIAKGIYNHRMHIDSVQTHLVEGRVIEAREANVRPMSHAEWRMVKTDLAISRSSDHHQLLPAGAGALVPILMRMRKLLG